MANPAAPQDFGPTSMTIDEMESNAQASEQPKPLKLEDIKLEGESVPANLRGKSVVDVLEQAKRLEEALRLSEQARLQSSQAPVAQAPPQVPPVPEPKELTVEEIKELHDTDPLKAIEYMQERAIRRAEHNLETRLGPLMAGTTHSAEQQARTKYAEEFELFGDQIAQVVAQLPNARAVLANPQAWDDIVSLVRGKTGNLERLIERKTASLVEKKAGEARAAQQDVVGFSATEPRSRPVPRAVSQLDETQREIARNLDMSEEDYIKWSQV